MSLQKISRIHLITLILASYAVIFVPTTNATYDSASRYGALENTTSSPDLVHRSDTPSSIRNSVDSSADVAQKVQEIVLQENFSLEQIENVLSRNTNELQSFLVGNNVGVLRFQLVQIKDQASRLETLFPQATDSLEQIQIENQLQILKTEQRKVENFISDKENKFSLFGWLVGLL